MSAHALELATHAATCTPMCVHSHVHARAHTNSSQPAEVPEKKGEPAAAADGMLRLELSCRNLAKMDFRGKSDPYVEVSEFRAAENRYKELGMTEVQMKELNPDFSVAIDVPCDANSVEPVRFSVWDDDSGGKADHNKRDLIGLASITKLALVEATQTASRTVHSSLTDRKGNTRGKLHIKVIGGVSMHAKRSKQLVKVTIHGILSGSKIEIDDSDLVKVRITMPGHVADSLINGEATSVFETPEVAMHTLNLAEWQTDCLFWYHTDEELQIGFEVLKCTSGTSKVIGHGRLIAESMDSKTGKREQVPVARGSDGQMKDNELSHMKAQLKAADAARLDIELSVTNEAEFREKVMSNILTPFDADHDGTISVEELGKLMTVLEIHDDPKALHAKLDKDGSGTVDTEELLQYLQEEQMGAAFHASMFALEGKSSNGNAPKQSIARQTTLSRDHTVTHAGVTIIDRETKMSVDEFVPSHVLYGIKSQKVLPDFLLRRFLHKLTLSKGDHMRSAASKAEIPKFVDEHKLERDCWDKPIEEYATFDEFFGRGVRPECRPIASPDNDSVVVSAADCRLMVFPTIDSAARIWVKGQNFSVANVFGRQGRKHAGLFSNGSMAIFRLSPQVIHAVLSLMPELGVDRSVFGSAALPLSCRSFACRSLLAFACVCVLQDYHRWHWPLGGTVGKQWAIGDALYTVNPEAIRSFDVYTENKRVVCELYTAAFGLVIMVVVGATVVGSINFLPGVHEEGVKVKKGACHGRFGFGGSTVLLFFQPGTVKFDTDLRQFSSQPVEVLVKTGEQIGRSVSAVRAETLGQSGVELVSSVVTTKQELLTADSRVSKDLSAEPGRCKCCTVS